MKRGHAMGGGARAGTRVLRFAASAVFFAAAASHAASRADGAEGAGPVRLAVAVVDLGAGCGCRDAKTELGALVGGLEILGVPYEILGDGGRLAEFRVALTGGALDNNVVSQGLAEGLYDFVENGGTLVAAGEIGSRMHPLFGVTAHVPSRRRYRMTFTGSDPSLKYLDHRNEKTVSLGNGESHRYDEVIWSHGYRLSPEATPLASFEDGSVGMAVHRYGRGKAYLVGISHAESVLLPRIGKDFEAQRGFVNGVETSADFVLLALRALYEGAYDPFVYLSPVPFARPAALVLTHDVDAQTSFGDSLKFAALEERYGTRSTFFETTKYFKDANDIDYFNVPENVRAIRELKERGWDIGSHTVSHYKDFRTSPEGDRSVTRGTYDPEKAITVWGEAKVSKELLDRAVPGQNTAAFRSGSLEFPPFLIRVLEECGYLYDSTFSANDVLTAFPYMALRERFPDSERSRVVEIPVTLDESMGFLTPKNVDAAVRAWLEVVREYAKNEGVAVLLIHPSDTRDKTYKLDAQERVMREVRSMGGWMGDLSSFGAFWRSRDELEFAAYGDGKGSLTVRVRSGAAGLHPAVGFVVGGGSVKRVAVEDWDGRPLDYRAESRDGKLFVGGLMREASFPP